MEVDKMKSILTLTVFLIFVSALLVSFGCAVDSTLPDGGEKEMVMIGGDDPINEPYYGDYTTIPGGTPADYGFTYGIVGTPGYVNDHFAITPEGYLDTSPSPGGWESAAFSPDMGLFDRNEDGGIAVEWQVMYPSEPAGSYRELNKLYIALVDENGELTYRFMYRPLTTEQERQTVDMELTLGEKKLAEVRTRKLVPYGLNADWIRFKAEITATNIKISMDHDGSGYVQYIDVADDTHSRFRKLHFLYRTGEDLQNYYMYVDAISVYPIV